MKFYKVNSEFFELDRKFSFPIYLYDLQRKERFVEIYPRSPITQEHMEKWDNILGEYAYLQVFHEDKDDFLLETDLTEKDLLNANAEYFRLMKLQTERIKEHKALKDKSIFLRHVLFEAEKNNDFMPIINKVKAEVMCWPLYESENISIVTGLVEKLFKQDLAPIRSAALAFEFAKMMKITKIQELAYILMGSLLKDFGEFFIPRYVQQDKENYLRDETYLKHPMYSIYILSKSSIEIPDKVKRIILEHHERDNGSGFPRGKKESMISLSSAVVGLADDIIMLNLGKSGKAPMELRKVLEIFNKRLDMEGINTNYPYTLLETLAVLLIEDEEG